MKKMIATIACSLPLALASTVYAQTGTAPPAPTPPATPSGGAMTPPPHPAPAPAPEPTQKVTGWSVKNKILGSSVYNEKGKKVGDVDDVILKNNGKAVYFVIGAGGFLGLGEHDVAIPYEKIVKNGDKLLLKGYTKEQLKAMPAVKVEKSTGK